MKKNNKKNGNYKKSKNVNNTQNKKPKKVTEKVEENVETNKNTKPKEITTNDTKEEVVIKPKKNIKKIIIIILSIILFLVGISIILFFTLFGLRKSVTLEAGIKEIKLSDFYKQNIVVYKSSFITDISKLDLNQVKSYDIKLKVNNKEKVIKLNIVDRTSPKVKFKDYYANVDYEFNPDDFIEEIDDISETKINVANPPIINGYNDYPVKIQVIDSYNNKTEGNVILHIAMSRNEVIKELGSPLTKEDILYNPEETGDYINQEELDKINESGIGEYEIVIKDNNMEFKTKIKVQDTTPPELELQKVTIYEDQEVPAKEKFIKSSSDKSEYEVTLKSNLVAKQVGEQEVVIEAIDKYGNKVEKTTTLAIIKDTIPPVFKGLYNLSVNKYTKINYYSGITAYDEHDGNLEFSVDASSVNTSKYGTYYATYTAVDKSGNKVSAKRQIYVRYDAADRNAKLNDAFKKAGTNYESIRQWIMKNIRYTHEDGGSDKIWFGLTNWRGNCMVHAEIYKALLEKAGYEVKIIYTTNKSHYWCLVKINGVWRHSDATPTSLHNMISAATDAERYAHLQGRNWDRSKWPEAK